MKYIKTFEKILKKKDPEVMNNPLRDISYRFKDILKKLQKYDNRADSSSKVDLIFYNDNYIIAHYYFYNDCLFEISLRLNSDYTCELAVLLIKNTKYNETLLDLFKTIFIEYIVKDDYLYYQFTVPIKNMNYLIDELSVSFLAKISANKFNL